MFTNIRIYHPTFMRMGIPNLHTLTILPMIMPMAFLIGRCWLGRHGMAGSAALILLTLNTTLSAIQAIIYILIFGVGSTIGMGLLSLIMAIPFWYPARSLTWLHNGLQACVGVMTTILGGVLALSSGSSLWD